VPTQEQLIEWAVGWRASDSREGLSGEADMIERVTYAIRAGMLATPAAQRPGAVDVDGTHTATPCHWIEDTDSGAWDTACGNKHQFTTGDATDNGHSFCPYCGGRLFSQPASVEAEERCESGLPTCGPVTTWDSEGVGVCAKCAVELGWARPSWEVSGG
jgi:hypothetical protein